VSEQVDTSKLEPATLAKHLAKPEGPIGVAVSASLNKTNAALYTAARSKLSLQAKESILEVGFGNGHEIDRFLLSAPGVVYTGVDISETMVTDATLRNAAAIEQGRATLRLASSASLPFSEGCFDKALTLNTIYFWDDPAVDLKELRRVLRRGGRLVIGAIAPQSTKHREVYRYGFRFYEADRLTALLTEAGFGVVQVDVLENEIITAEGEKLRRDYFIVAGE
jgi:arsenite methyltransferase